MVGVCTQNGKNIYVFDFTQITCIDILKLEMNRNDVFIHRLPS